MTAEPAGGPVVHTTVGSQGPRIAFLHGLFGQGRNWTTVATALSDAFRVTLVDLPNHGRSPWTADVSYRSMAESVADLLGTQDEPGTVVGHSMGGKVAMVLALRHPALVVRLGVVDIAPVSYVGRHDFGGYVAAMRSLDLDHLRTRAEADEAMAGSISDSRVRAFLLQNLRRDRTGGWRWQMNLPVLGDSLDQLGGWPEGTTSDRPWPPYAGPVLWLAGAGSDYVTPGNATAMRSWFPRAQLVRIKGAGHWVHAEQPAVFTSVVRRFAIG